MKESSRDFPADEDLGDSKPYDAQEGLQGSKENRPRVEGETVACAGSKVALKGQNQAYN